MKGLLRPQISSCQHDTSLLFQFILSDFLNSRREFDSLIKHVSIDEKTLPLIIHTITNLSGPITEYMRIFSWSHDTGCLAKLKNHCAFFLQNSDPNDKRAQTLEKNSHKVWHISLHILDLTNQIQQAIVSSKKKNKEILQLITLWEEGITELDRSLISLAKTIAKLIPDFSDDENVIFFILKSHELMDHAFGKKYTYKLLNSLYSNLQKSEQFLQKNYYRRGFHNLIPVISDKISELEYSLCHK